MSTQVQVYIVIGVLWLFVGNFVTIIVHGLVEDTIWFSNHIAFSDKRLTIAYFFSILAAPGLILFLIKALSLLLQIMK